MSAGLSPTFWHGRRVLVTGHTGFKGAWLCRALHLLGAEVSGIALAPAEGPSAFAALEVAAVLAADHRLDIRDAAMLVARIRAARPQIVVHMAAQALVGAGYRDPTGTFATNLAGTLNVLQAIRAAPGVQAAVIVTSDKVYRNDGQGRAFTEADPLGGADPYSASKAAAEIAVAAWRRSFPADMPPLATARAGNVIGGGDFATERLVPDAVRAWTAGRPLMLRRPDATRPFQHVLDVLRGYLLLAERLVAAPESAPPALNFGPHDGEWRVRDLLTQWEAATGRPIDWREADGPLMVEAPRLALDSTLAGRSLGWAPRFDTPRAVELAAFWYAAWQGGERMVAFSDPAIGASLAPQRESAGI